MDEAESRAEHIDPALEATGWGVVEGCGSRKISPRKPDKAAGQRPHVWALVG